MVSMVQSLGQKALTQLTLQYSKQALNPRQGSQLVTQDFEQLVNHLHVQKQKLLQFGTDVSEQAMNSIEMLLTTVAEQSPHLAWVIKQSDAGLKTDAGRMALKQQEQEQQEQEHRTETGIPFLPQSHARSYAMDSHWERPMPSNSAAPAFLGSRGPGLDLFSRSKAISSCKLDDSLCTDMSMSTDKDLSMSMSMDVGMSKLARESPAPTSNIAPVSQPQIDYHQSRSAVPSPFVQKLYSNLVRGQSQQVRARARVCVSVCV
jgi:hypothetical protein